MNSLKVSMQGQIVGKLSIDKDENYHFEYDKSWIEKGFAMMHTIGYDTAGALMFGENHETNQAIFREIPPKELSDRKVTSSSSATAMILSTLIA